jgi:hypothetical protein
MKLRAKESIVYIAKAFSSYCIIASVHEIVENQGCGFGSERIRLN